VGSAFATSLSPTASSIDGSIPAVSRDVKPTIPTATVHWRWRTQRTGDAMLSRFSSLLAKSRRHTYRDRIALGAERSRARCRCRRLGAASCVGAISPHAHPAHPLARSHMLRDTPAHNPALHSFGLLPHSVVLLCPSLLHVFT